MGFLLDKTNTQQVPKNQNTFRFKIIFWNKKAELEFVLSL